MLLLNVLIATKEKHIPTGRGEKNLVVVITVKDWFYGILTE